MNFRAARLTLAAVFLMCAAPVRGSSVDYVPLADMIARADAVVLARIESLVELPADRRALFMETHTATVSVTDRLRGETPQRFQVEVQVGRHGNPSATAGVQVLAFLGHRVPHETKPQEGFQRLYGGYQGFYAVPDLVRGGSRDDQAFALAAIKTSIAACKGGAATRPARSKVTLNDEAVAPFVGLLASDSAPLRRWAISKALDGLDLTPLVARELTAALDHHDPEVRKTAAWVFMIRQYAPVRQKLEKMVDETGDAELRQRIRRYLAGRQVADHLGRMPADLSTRLVRYLVEHKHRSIVYSRSLDFDVTGDGRLTVSVDHKSYADLANDMLTFLKGVDFAKAGVLPFEFTLYLWAEEGELRYKVQEPH
jgi:hypothetical protein